MKIDEMEAGRELDALIAEKIFGRRVSEGLEQESGTGLHGIWVSLQPYSTDIAAVWQVIKALIKLGWHPHVWYEPGVVWTCELLSFDRDKNPWVVANAETEMLVICRAALKTIQATKKKEGVIGG